MDSVLHKTQAHYGGRRQLHFGGGNGFGGGGGHGESGSPTLDEVFLMGGQSAAGGGDSGGGHARRGYGHGGGGSGAACKLDFLSRVSDSPDSDQGYGTSYGSFLSGGKTQGSGTASSSDEGSDLTDIMVSKVVTMTRRISRESVISDMDDIHGAPICSFLMWPLWSQNRTSDRTLLEFDLRKGVPNVVIPT